MKKLDRKLAELDKENNELKTDLSNYVSYGIGNWKVFKNIIEYFKLFFLFTMNHITCIIIIINISLIKFILSDSISSDKNAIFKNNQIIQTLFDYYSNKFPLTESN